MTERLAHRGVPIVAYHGKMEAQARRKNQELWMSGEKRVLAGTVAFGLGINKPDVRAVVHLSLPKSLEQFYQEAGRAGRDGEPADCVLLWQKRDLALLAHFTKEIQDADEQQRAWQRFRVMRRFVEEPGCRHRRICLHFGETPKWETCQACDHCGMQLDWMNVAVEPVMAEAQPRRARTKPTPVTLTRGPVDPHLAASLRAWRSELAKAQRVPAYVILNDATLDALCRQRPRNLQQLLEVPGIGEKRAERYGQAILTLLEL
jgi:ATP-dependent DNA helicase RecQ